VALGSKVVARDAAGAWAMFEEWALPRIAAGLQSHPARAKQLLQVMYAWVAVDADAHARAIKKLQDALGAPLVFGRAMAVLVWLESDLSENLLDLYLYYAAMGSTAAAPRDRAAAASIIHALTVKSPAPLLALVPRLQQVRVA
jgi:hypothetical protein